MNEISLQFEKLPYPKADFTGKTIIVVGSNTGMGKEALRHFVRLNAFKVIITVRSLPKGRAAQEDIEATTNRHGVMEVWEIDLSSSTSVKAFAARVDKLPRVDAVVANASVATLKFEILEGNESMIIVNVINTMLLLLLLVPILLQVSALEWEIVPIITVVGSGVHLHTKFPAGSPQIFSTPSRVTKLSGWKGQHSRVYGGCMEAFDADLSRCAVSKLIQIFAVREIAARMTENRSKVVLNIINPGLAKTELTRNATGFAKIAIILPMILLARTAEEASRTLVHAVSVGPESHRLYFTNCDVTRYGWTR